MKRQIRRNVFETNSSSMHSIVITKDDSLIPQDKLKNGIWLHKNGIWEIWNEEDLCFFRSPFECLTTFESKVRYAIASLCNWNDKANEVFKEIEQIVLETIPECKGIELPKNNYDDKICYGGVDEDILSDFLAKNNITLKEFLLNKKYVVIVDGDEYCIFDELKNSGLIHKDNIVSEFS